MPRATVRSMRKTLLFSALGLLLVSAAAAWAAVPSGGVDPRSGGLQINLGEWAIGPEAKAIRPGRVTFVVANRGKQRHGLEIRSLGSDDAISGDDEVKTVRLEPGKTTRVTVDLAPGQVRDRVLREPPRRTRNAPGPRRPRGCAARDPAAPQRPDRGDQELHVRPATLFESLSAQPSAGRTRTPPRTPPPQRVARSAPRSSPRGRVTPSASPRPAATRTCAPSTRGCAARSSSGSS